VRVQDGEEIPVKKGDFWRTPGNVRELHYARLLGEHAVSGAHLLLRLARISVKIFAEKILCGRIFAIDAPIVFFCTAQAIQVQAN
jgi:hypothetical protein